MDDNDSFDLGRNWGYIVFGVVVEGYEVVDVMGEVEIEYKVLLGFVDVFVEFIILYKVMVLLEF